MQNGAEGQISVIELDVSDSKSIDNFLSKLKQKNLKIDILVDNAGVSANKDEWSVESLNWTLKTVKIMFYGRIFMAPSN
jgi:NADP-dependent 3-hydroxy acid dehydrogenase YdfG